MAEVAELQRQQDSWTRAELTRWLVGRTRTLLPPLVGATVASVLGGLAWVALLAYAATCLTAAAVGHPVAMPVMIAVLAGLSIGKGLLRYLEHYAGHWVAFTALQRLREQFFAALIPQAPAATRGRAGAELTNRATRDIDRIEVFFAHTLPPAVSAVLVPLVSLCWLGSAVSAPLALALAPVALGMVTVPLLSARASWAGAQRVAAARGAVAETVGDDAQGRREIIAFQAQPQRLAQLDHRDAELQGARERMGAGMGARAAISAVLRGAALLVVAGVTVGAGLPVAQAVIAAAVAVSLWNAFDNVDDFVEGLDAAFASTRRVRAVIDAEPMVGDPSSPIGFGPGSSVRFDEVTFRYPGTRRDALQDVSFAVDEGEWFSLAGVSGSGKSTAADLLLRAWDIDHGTITLGGVDIAAVPLDVLRERVGIASQRGTVISETVRANLELASGPVADEAIRRVVAATRLVDWIATLPEGLDTPLEERGLDVSGGQLQRLEIARALLAGPRVLILDEALSQLDAATAAQVRDEIRRGWPRLTVLEITHRVDTIPAGGRLLVLDAGRVIAADEISVLQADSEVFARLAARD